MPSFPMHLQKQLQFATAKCAELARHKAAADAEAATAPPAAAAAAKLAGELRLPGRKGFHGACYTLKSWAGS